MSKAKDSLLDEIARKIKRKKELRKEISIRSENIEAFALKMINDMEDMITTTANTSLLASLVPLYAKSFEERVKVIDSGATIDVKWDTNSDIPRIDGILIRWSKDYQIKSDCEEQLLIDVTSLLLK